jgi:prepilin-type N-terminal cleavage/methylation domain-containing protein
MTQRGFTLIELSMVLVIIGLLVSSVLVGRDLIRAAEVRATIRQIENFGTATQTFRLKYSCLPGDCLKADALGFNAATNGDGNGQLGCPGNDASACADASSFINSQPTRELVNYWYHLSAANLIGNNFVPFDATDTHQYAGVVSPSSELLASTDGTHPSTGWAVRYDINIPIQSGYRKLGTHEFILTSSAPINNTEIGRYDIAELYAIDSKIDDGMPNSGTIYVGEGFAVSFGVYYGFYLGGAPGTPGCVDSTVSPLVYNVTYTTPYCSLIIRSPF